MRSILFIDAYDSFSNNIAALLREQLSVDVELIRIDDPRFVLNDDAFRKYLNGFDAVLAGPGPGHPANGGDTGLIGRLWNLPNEYMIPALGICLGFQSLCLAFGADVVRLDEPRHGLVTEITHNNSDIFKNTGKVLATQYHSLSVRAGHGAGDLMSDRRWVPSISTPELVPLAWDLTDANNGPIFAATRHASRPLWGVQYHPESICTSDSGRQLVANWWRAASAWNTAHGRLNYLTEEINVSSGRNLQSSTHSTVSKVKTTSKNAVQWQKLKFDNKVELTDIVEWLQQDRENYHPIVLESGQRDTGPVNPETGRFSIIGLHDASSMHFHYSTATHEAVVRAAGRVLERRSCAIVDAYASLQALTNEMSATGGSDEIPFWGGFIGYISYEAGIEGISVAPHGPPPDRPDIWFILVERSIVVDHRSNVAYIQTIRCSDHQWLHHTQDLLLDRFESRLRRKSQEPKHNLQTSGSILTAPVKHEYCRKITDCQAELRAGRSYELCLTDHTSVGSSIEAWGLYRRLRSLNPAPFGSYLQFPGRNEHGLPGTQDLDVVSSSPERFFSWSRDGKCQFRPIKGTLKKGPGVDRSTAEEVLGSTKEQAENLMIVDLIRHDLNGVARYSPLYRNLTS